MPRALTLSADGVKAVAWPTKKVQFSVPSGDHAGAYALHNVNVRAVVYPGCDSASEWNFEIPAPTERRSPVREADPCGSKPGAGRWALTRSAAKCEATLVSNAVLQEMAWLRAFGEKYRGQWVALRRDELLGSNPSRVELHRDLAQRGLLDEALLVWLDAETK